MNVEDSQKYTQLKKSLSPTKILVPIVLGLGMVLWLMFNEIKADTFSFLEWSVGAVFWIFVCFMMMAIRDIAYMWRVRILTDGKISWRNAFDVIMLWEFSSAISPSVVGGTGPAIYFL